MRMMSRSIAVAVFVVVLLLFVPLLDGVLAIVAAIGTVLAIVLVATVGRPKERDDDPRASTNEQLRALTELHAAGKLTDQQHEDARRHVLSNADRAERAANRPTGEQS